MSPKMTATIIFEVSMDLKKFIRDIPNFPKPGIIFKDITTLLNNPEALNFTIDSLTEFAKKHGAEVITAAESRGFIFGVPVAYKLKLPFVPIRKPKKLPAATFSAEYDLEYGTDKLEIHQDAFIKGKKVLIIDDLLATGGTTKAMIELVEKVGGEIVGIGYVIELAFLNGSEKLKKYKIHSLIKY